MHVGKNEHMEDWSKGKENESAYEANTCTGMYVFDSWLLLSSFFLSSFSTA